MFLDPGESSRYGLNTTWNHKTKDVRSDEVLQHRRPLYFIYQITIVQY